MVKSTARKTLLELLGTLFLACTLSASVQAATEAPGLLETCQENDPFCRGFLAGVYMAAAANLASPGSAYSELKVNGTTARRATLLGWEWCTPEDTTLSELQKSLVKWLSDHPEHRQVPATSQIAMATAANFPCPEPETPTPN
ncbi:MAG: hypothetical protein CL938_00210 [Deltaproteobacteria bacterium]|jgi:hypothetical protein|nr:hypothetical protein [Deltaproteobacteria bacterium]